MKKSSKLKTSEDGSSEDENFEAEVPQDADEEDNGSEAAVAKSDFQNICFESSRRESRIARSLQRRVGHSFRWSISEL